MCGRYTLTRRQAEITERFGVEELLCGEDEIHPRFNIAPSQMVPVVYSHEGKRALAMFKWGLIPFWTKELSAAKPVINARSETMASKPFFRQAVAKRRCLIPADGFFEWRKDGKAKTPLFIHESARRLFAFAGLWDEWRSEDGEVLRTCTIITTAANATMQPVHDRMPVIVRPEHESLWLDCSVKEIERLAPVLEPIADEDLSMYEVRPRVNSARYAAPDLIHPVADNSVIQTSLFG